MQKETVENYLKTIYHLSRGNSVMVTNKQLAVSLKVIPATVTEAVKKLSSLNLVDYEKSYGTRLTPKGVKTALSIVRRHRIWETYLARELGFGWDEVHEIAEELEHVSSEKLIGKLYKKLGNPLYDPHGDPIPDEKGNLHKIQFIKLSEAKSGGTYVLSGVDDHSAAFLKFLDKNAIKIGDQLRILEKEAFDGSVLVRVKGEDLRLSLQVAMNLLLK